MLKFYEVVEQVLVLLQREGRVSCRALKREFDLDEEYLADLTAEIIDAKQLAVDEDGKVLVWVGGGEKRKREKGETGKISLESRVQSPDKI